MKAILSVDEGKAYLQNADTNSYLEGEFSKKADLENGTVPAEQLPGGIAGGIATLDDSGKVPISQLPVGTAGGVVVLDSSGKVPVEQLPAQGYSREEMLSDTTKTMYGLSNQATPNTIFQKLAMPYGYYGFDITVVTEDGLPVPNVVLNGLEDFEGNTPVTNENGRYALAVSESSTPTLTISKYLGIVNGSHALSSDDSYVFTPYTIVVAKDTTTRTISSSDTYNIFAPEGTVVDLCAVGGGGGGGFSDGYDGVKGAGGGGGYCSNLTNITSISTGEISFAIGSGGSGAHGSNGLNGYAGGTTTITYNGTTLLSANGGSGGTGYVSSSGGGGAGNGRGGHVNGGAGVAATVYLFDDTTLGLPGGGGGGAALNGAGGAPYGGKGGNYSTAPTGGTGPGGGGGGSMGNKNVGTHVAGSGYKGGVFVRVRFSS